MEKVLVIGSNSFSGASFIDHLLGKGIMVFGCSRSAEVATDFRIYESRNRNRNFKFLQIDLNEELPEIFKLINSERIETVCNFAAQSMVAQSWDYPEDWMNTNVTSFNKLVSGLANVDFLERFLHVTTPEVYGNTSGLVNELNTFNPSTPYAVSRAAADMTVNCFHKYKNFPFIGTRASNVYGVGQQIYRIIPKTVHSILKGEKLYLDGGGLSERNFVNITDVSTANELLLRYGELGNYYHISGESQISIKDLVIKICSIMQVIPDDVIKIGPERIGKDTFYQLDSSKIKTKLKWEPKVDLSEGLEEVVSWMKLNWDTLRDVPTNYFHKK